MRIRGKRGIIVDIRNIGEPLGDSRTTVRDALIQLREMRRIGKE